jgi:hypothetical protein
MAGDGRDGRLELDELGHAVDAATALDLLEDEHARPTWAERLAATPAGRWWDRHPWVRRSAAAAAVVAAAGLALSWASSPPPDDLAVVVTISAAGEGVRADPRGPVLASEYLVSGVRPGDDVRIEGLVGPGVGPTAVREVSPGRVRVTAQLACGEPGALTAAERRYSLQVTRTDQWGRAVAESRAVPEAAAWAGAVHDACWTAVSPEAFAAQDVDVVVGPAYTLVRLAVRLTSRLPAEALVHTLPIDDGKVAAVLVDSASVQAGGDVALDVPLRVRSCDRPRAPRWVAADDVVPSSSYAVPGPGLQLDVTLTDDGESRLAPLAFTEEQAAAVQSGIDEVCDGVPSTTVSLVDVGTARVSGAVVLMPVVLEVRSEGTARRVLVESDDLFGEAVPQPVGPDGRVAATWAFFCQDSVPSMTVSLQVAAGGRDYPWRWQSDDPRLAEEVRRACPGTE